MDSSQISTEYFVKIFSIFTAIGVAIWRFISWSFGIDARIKALETSNAASADLHKTVRETMNALKDTVTSLDTKVDLIINNKIK